MARFGPSRFRWIFAFAVLLVAVTAMPVLADEPPVPASDEIEPLPPALQAQGDWLPDATQVSAGIAAVESEEAAREEELEAPPAVHEREESADAYAEVGAAGAEELLREVFAEQLATLNNDPARAITAADEVEPVGATAATVTEDGDSALLDAGVPVRTEDEDGDVRHLDLSLEATAAGFETDNALSEVAIGDSAADPVRVGEAGLSITQLGADASSDAHRFGEQSVFSHESLTDTDTLVAPTAGGVEIFDLIRSEQSPESFRFRVGMPQGAELRPDGAGGAMVVRGDEALASIPFPSAVDAQGSEVPVELAVEGDTIVLHLAHRDGDYAMPILLDPILEDWVNTNTKWQNGYNLNALENGAWQGTSEPSGLIYLGTGNPCYFTCWGRGLYLTAPSRNYGANTYAHWAYSAPNIDSYVSKAWLNPFWRDNHNCSQSQYGQPHDYDGFWGDNQWNLLQTNQANDVGSVAAESWGRAFIVGLSSGGGINIPCWRDVYVGGAAIWLDDWAAPSVSATVTGVPTNWIGAGQSVSIGASSSDSGLGVRLVTVTHEGKGVIGQENVGCTGLYGNRCPTSRGSTITMTSSSFGEGIRSSSVSAEDPTGKATTGASFTTKVDYSPPEVVLEGQFAQATGDDLGGVKGDEKTEKLPLPVYNMKILATDGSNASNTTRRSGVKNIEIYLDGVKQTVGWTAQTATEDSRPMTQNYQVKLSTLTTSGLHKLEVKAVDQVNNVRVRSLEFEYFPATGMKDEYVMHHFLLEDGKDEREGDHPKPELAVNVVNGNLVYHEQDVEIEGPNVDLEVERFYNSMLPTSENTEWGDGWTLAQTPDLNPTKTGGSTVANRADVVDPSGLLEGNVSLPTTTGATTFDPDLRATLTKKATGGYELEDDTEETQGSVSFDSTGQAEAVLSEGEAKIDYSYESGKLAEIEVEDPSTFKASASELEIPKPQLLTQAAYASSFGVNGTADGQLKNPSDVAVDSKGNLWVVDKGNNRVQKFDSSGKFLMKFGATGTADGQFTRPTAIAIAANGDLLVTDAGNGRVQRFSSSGAFLSKFGSKGTGNGQFSGAGPEGIAIDAAGNIWVSDTGAGRLQKFTSAGVFVKAAGSKGTGTGQLGEPTGMDVDLATGNVWVADWTNHRIAVFNSNGEFVAQYGSLGSGDGQFNNPDEVEVDSIGNVWVGDKTNQRIQQLSLNGQFKAKFGSAGAGAGQFAFAYPIGISTDSQGHLWVTDVNNYRIQQWTVPVERPTFLSTFGTNGAADGQLKNPGDVASSYNGTFWVVDKLNHRIQKFDSSGKFVSKFGSFGTGNGQFNRPTQIAVDRDGNLLVADANNNRIQKFDGNGNFLMKFGSLGTGNGQFTTPEGVATDPDGNIWVSDTSNGRIQKFDENGKFIEVVSSKGSGAGQLGEPTGLDVDPVTGNVWVADWTNHRVSVFDEDGDFVGSFGSLGTGPGQFKNPNEIEIDAKGNVWVGDVGNQRIQRFDLNGQFVGQFGSAGSGAGQFAFTYPMGISADRYGRILVADVNNHRIQRWQLGNYTTPTPPPIDPSDGDPKVEVDTEAGLVKTLTGNAAGSHTYTHVGDDLTAHTGPSGKAEYVYDTSGRMTKVTLPNGTWASIAYGTDARVKSVTLKQAAWTSSKTTTFEYQDTAPRRSVVDPPDAPVITYEIANDGSVLKWWNSAQPPTIDYISGTLWDHKEKDDDLWAGDHVLDVQAYSPEGIASIWVVTNGHELVHETKCDQNPEVAGTECVTPAIKSEWVMSTEQYPPGHLPIEVIVTDHAEGTTTKRFWVDIPEPPPPPAPGTPIPPKFAEVERFRNEYGLEKVFPVADEIERNERILNTINAWYQGDPVARASRERWGVPLRPEDVAELEYREWLYDVNGEKIDQWVEATSPGSYAGYYMDHAAGGVMRIGFTSNQSAQLASLESSLGLVGGSSRLQVYPTTPTTPYLSVRATGQSVLNAMESNSTLRNLVVSVEDDEAGKTTRVGTPQVAQVESILHQMLGVNAPVSVQYETGSGAFLDGRYRNSGRMRAGDYINSDAYIFGGIPTGGPCTAGFGAEDFVDKPGTGDDLHRLFVLTAGHCAVKLDQEVWRNTYDGDFEFPFADAGKSEVGRVKRSAFQYVEAGGVRTDASAIRITEGGIVPTSIAAWEGNGLPTEPASRARKGNTVCYSGAISKRVACGKIIARSLNWVPEGVSFGVAGYWVQFPPDKLPQHGDSGGPVWNLRTGASIGLISAERNSNPQETLVAPLLHPPNMPANRVPGILHHVGMQPLSLKLGG